MTIEQAIRLINCTGISVTNPTAWADLGAGTGIFTKALASLIAPGSKILAVDADSSALRQINLPETVRLRREVQDFTKIELEPASLDGLLMANSLHFVKDKQSFLKRTSGFLVDQGTILIVEYDMTKSNPWVPYPVSFDELGKIFISTLGLRIRKIAETPSLYRRGMIYGSWPRLDRDS